MGSSIDQNLDDVFDIHGVLIENEMMTPVNIPVQIPEEAVLQEAEYHLHNKIHDLDDGHGDTSNPEPTLFNDGDDSTQELHTFLKNWKMERLFDHFKGNNITLDVLKIIKKQHLERLLNTHDLGTQFTFEYHFENWRNSIGLPLSDNVATMTRDLLHTPERSTNSPAPSVASSSSIHSVQSPTSPAGVIDSEFTLATILNESPKGIILTDFYTKFEKYNEEQRNSLIDCIARYFDEKGKPLTLAASYKLEREILERFPSEKLEYYRTGKRGKLYNKFSNLRASFKMAVSKHVTSPKKSKENEVTRKDRTFEPEAGAEMLIRSLKYDNLSAEQFDTCWQACAQYRLNDIKDLPSTAEVFNRWPFYKTPTGFRLIDMDFNVLYKSGNGLFSKLDNVLKEKLLSFLLSGGNIKDKQIKAILQKLKDDDSIGPNGRDCALLWAIHGYLVPTTKIVKKDSFGKKNTVKFTIKDSQSSFVFLGQNVQMIEDHLRYLKTKKAAIQPFILAVGEEIHSLTNIFVFFDDVKFEFPNFLRAVDICFKIFYVFNLSFPVECSMFWNFIATAFYDITCNHSNSRVHVLTEALRQ